jgi:predicted membrane-bound mannosyltransferase
VFFYSGTFFHWDGVKGIVQAYSAWFATGTEGHGHEKPWDYWLRLIGRYELTAAIGLVSCVFCQQLKSIHLRYLAIYGVGTSIAYSIVHYKTPWCIISIIWPFLFLFGVAITLAPLKFRAITYQIAAAALLIGLGVAIWFAGHKDYTFIWPFVLVGSLVVVAIAQRSQRDTKRIMAIAICLSLGSSIWLNYFRCTTDTEPYVYVQTYNDVFKLTRPLLALAKRDPTNYGMTGHLVRTSSYPLPWMLGDFTHVGYYEHENLPPQLDGDFLLVQSDRIKEIEGKLQKSYYTEPLTIRPYQDTSKVYFEANRFKDFFPGRVPDFNGKGPR